MLLQGYIRRFLASTHCERAEQTVQMQQPPQRQGRFNLNPNRE
jgi:hypothetical protein